MPVSQRQFARQRDMLGYGPANVYSLFERPTEPLEAFAPEVQDTLIAAEDVRRAREAAPKQWEADDALNDILDNAQNMDTQTLSGMLTSDPRIMRSANFPMLQDYVKTRKELERPSPYSDMVLGPQFSAKIENPQLRGAFEQDMVGGMNFKQAQTNHLKRAADLGGLMAAAKAGYTPAEAEQFRLPGGGFDEAAIQYHATQREKNDPNDELRRIQTQRTFFDRKRENSIDGKLSTEEEQLDTELGDRATQLFRAMRTGGATAGQPMASAAPLTPDANTQADIGYEQAEAAAPVTVPTPPSHREMFPAPWEEAAFKEQKIRTEQQAKEEHEAAAAWTKGKQSLAAKLKETYPDPRHFLGVLRKAYLNENAPTEGTPLVDDLGNIVVDKADLYILEKLGLKPGDVAFEEPGNLRTGTQKVTNIELLHELAKDALRESKFLDAEGNVLEDAPKAVAPPLTPEQEKKKAAIAKAISDAK